MFTDSDALKLALSLKLPEDYTSLIKIIYGTILDKKPEIDLKDICNNFYSIYIPNILSTCYSLLRRNKCLLNS